MASQPRHAGSRNRLLAALPPDELARLQPQLEHLDMATHATILRQGEKIDCVIFPETGWLSCLMALDHGDAGEVGLIGREGMAGVALVFGDDRMTTEVMVQGPGAAVRVATDAFLETLNRNPDFRALLLRYALAFHFQVSQTAACNGRHQVEQRLARWLLMAHDRADGETFPMTHEFLSLMLGVRRAGVTVAAGALQRAGYIRYDRGSIEIVERPGLEAGACDCYDVARREFERLLGPGAGS